MTRVVPDQKNKFETDELFRKLSRDSEIRFTGYRDRSHEERMQRFKSDCLEGKCTISFSGHGLNLLLFLGPQSKEKKTEPSKEFLDFEKESGKAHLKSNFLMNGVTVTFKGVVDLQRLDGTACLEYDVVQGKHEDKVFRDTIEQSRLRMKEFEDHQKRIKLEPLGEGEINPAVFLNPEYHSMIN